MPSADGSGIWCLGGLAEQASLLPGAWLTLAEEWDNTGLSGLRSGRQQALSHGSRYGNSGPPSRAECETLVTVNVESQD
jgi:hypothetical protein